MEERKFDCPDYGYEQTFESLPSGYEARFLNYWVNQDLIKICRAVDRWATKAGIIEVDEERNA